MEKSCLIYGLVFFVFCHSKSSLDSEIDNFCKLWFGYSTVIWLLQKSYILKSRDSNTEMFVSQSKNGLFGYAVCTYVMELKLTRIYYTAR